MKPKLFNQDKKLNYVSSGEGIFIKLTVEKKIQKTFTDNSFIMFLSSEQDTVKASKDTLRKSLA